MKFPAPRSPFRKKPDPLAVLKKTGASFIDEPAQYDRQVVICKFLEQHGMPLPLVAFRKNIRGRVLCFDYNGGGEISETAAATLHARLGIKPFTDGGKTYYG